MNMRLHLSSKYIHDATFRHVVIFIAAQNNSSLLYLAFSVDHSVNWGGKVTGANMHRHPRVFL